jgi:MarR family transcriptional regulator for hemolysin
MRPTQIPIGLALSRAARVVSRAFDSALADVGGSLPAWLVLLNLNMHRDANQRVLAEAVGVSGATLTHHLNAMERDGLLSRRRDPDNRRNHIIELTAEGEAALTRLAPEVLSFDQRLRTNFTAEELNTLRSLLDRLCDNVGASPSGPPWAGLIEVAADRPPRKRSRKVAGRPGG